MPALVGPVTFTESLSGKNELFPGTWHLGDEHEPDAREQAQFGEIDDVEAVFAVGTGLASSGIPAALAYLQSWRRKTDS